jgi:hypothetical protein
MIDATDRRSVVVIATLALFASAPNARAQPATAQAVVLFDRGKQLMREGKLDDACVAFESSQKLAPAVSTLLNLANCRERSQQIATAWGLFREAERQTRGAATPADVQLHDTAVARASRLEPRYSKLAIVVSHEVRDIEGLVILRDGEAVEVGSWNGALPIDGGEHEIVARAPHHREWSMTITIKDERDDRRVTVPDLEEEVVVPPPSRSKLAPIVLGAASLALVAAAVGLEIAGEHRYDAAIVEPDPQRSDELWRAANLRRHLAEGTGVGAAACASVAIYMLVRRHDTATEPRVAVAAAVGNITGASLLVRW